MTYDKAIEELMRYSTIVAELENLTELIKRLRIKDTLKAMQCDRERVDTSGHPDISSNIARVEEIEHIYNRRIQSNLESIQGVERKIELIESSIHRQILRRKYIDLQKLELIAYTLNRGYSSIKKLHNEAVRIYSKLPS